MNKKIKFSKIKKFLEAFSLVVSFIEGIIKLLS